MGFPIPQSVIAEAVKHIDVNALAHEALAKLDSQAIVVMLEGIVKHELDQLNHIDPATGVPFSHELAADGAKLATDAQVLLSRLHDAHVAQAAVKK